MTEQQLKRNFRKLYAAVVWRAIEDVCACPNQDNSGRTHKGRKWVNAATAREFLKTETLYKRAADKALADSGVLKPHKHAINGAMSYA